MADMRIETHHRGKSLTFRVLTPPDRAPALAVIMEDKAGRAVMIRLCQELENYMVPREEKHRQRRICIIKEPLLPCTINAK